LPGALREVGREEDGSKRLHGQYSCRNRDPKPLSRCDIEGAGAGRPIRFSAISVMPILRSAGLMKWAAGRPASSLLPALRGELFLPPKGTGGFPVVSSFRRDRRRTEMRPSQWTCARNPARLRRLSGPVAGIHRGGALLGPSRLSPDGRTDLDPVDHDAHTL